MVNVRSKELGLGSHPSPRKCGSDMFLDLAVSQTQFNLGLVNMSDPKNLDIAISQTCQT
jgi:hypothetical protein